MLGAMAGDELADPAHLESLRLDSLYTEILADRGAYAVTRDVSAAVRLLVKIGLGAREVNAESYLQQAAEIFDSEGVETAGISHPEIFIRSRALELWAGYVDGEERPEPMEDRIESMIQGTPRFDQLDLLGQERFREQTKSLLQIFLEPAWIRTGAAMAHAGLFFDDIEADSEEPASMGEPPVDPGLQRYFSYVLTDFVALTRELEDGAVAQAYKCAEILEVADQLTVILNKELRIPKKTLTRIRKEHPKILQSLTMEPTS